MWCVSVRWNVLCFSMEKSEINSSWSYKRDRSTTHIFIELTLICRCVLGLSMWIEVSALFSSCCEIVCWLKQINDLLWFYNLLHKKINNHVLFTRFRLTVSTTWSTLCLYTHGNWYRESSLWSDSFRPWQFSLVLMMIFIIIFSCHLHKLA